MSYQQGNAAYPQQGQQQAYVAPPPPAGYPQADADQKYPASGDAADTTSRGGHHGHHHHHHHNGGGGGGFLRGWQVLFCRSGSSLRFVDPAPWLCRHTFVIKLMPDDCVCFSFCLQLRGALLLLPPRRLFLITESV
jgi:hypothetical protein